MCVYVCLLHVSISVIHIARQIKILEIDHLSSCCLVSFVHFDSVFHIVCFGHVSVFVCNHIVILICEFETLEIEWWSIGGEHLVAIVCVLAWLSVILSFRVFCS